MGHVLGASFLLWSDSSRSDVFADIYKSRIADGNRFLPQRRPFLSLGAVQLMNNRKKLGRLAKRCHHRLIFAITLSSTGQIVFLGGWNAHSLRRDFLVFRIQQRHVFAGHLRCHLHGPTCSHGGSVGPEGSASAFIHGCSVLFYHKAFPTRKLPEPSLSRSESDCRALSEPLLSEQHRRQIPGRRFGSVPPAAPPFPQRPQRLPRADDRRMGNRLSVSLLSNRNLH